MMMAIVVIVMMTALVMILWIATAPFDVLVSRVNG
jgi:hypothetical protein